VLEDSVQPEGIIVNAKYEKYSRVRRIAKNKWSIGSVLLVVLSLYAIIKINIAIDSIEYALTPPTLPEYQQAETLFINPIGWPEENSEWFHHASQGTATLPIPYKWFVALEAPKRNPWFVLFGTNGSFIDEYILRLGFIKQDVSQLNPDALPIGFAETKSIYFPGIDRKASAIGLTCAGCHTGQLIYGGKRFVVDGGPATIDMGSLARSLGAALGQTALSGKFFFFNGRFDRFAQNVLGSSDNILSRNRLKKELSLTIADLAESSDVINVTEGFTRLDALNRIGNQVFAQDMGRAANYAPIDAPVTFPHIWTTSWFDWVQYDGSIMQPLARNSGEALGVKAYVDTTGPVGQRFASSVNVNNLDKIERWLGGTHPKQNNNQLNGLLAPKWPAEFPPIDGQLADAGEKLYKKRCQGCHLPPVNSEEFWRPKYWKTIQYVKDKLRIETQETYLHLNIIPTSKIGTDPAQAGVLANRTIDTTGLDLTTDICTWVAGDSLDSDGEALTYVSLNDSATLNFGLALGAFVEKTNRQWFDQNLIPEHKRAAYEGLRPNCLQTTQGYKARPLNGVWATAPFLHNGSIATIYDLLSPLADRPTLVQLGNQEFDAKHLGIVQNETAQSLIKGQARYSYQMTPDYSDGLFILDTREPGNHNTGHIFDDRTADEPIQGRIGPRLTETEKMSLIEYLKDL
jgi:hypothetical protein